LAKSLSARTNVKRIGVGFGDKSCLLDSTGSQDGGHAEQRSVLLVFTSFIKLWSGSRQQSVRFNKTTVALDLKVDRTNAKPSAEDLAGKQDNS
jgi:hypothetical protein